MRKIFLTWLLMLPLVTGLWGCQRESKQDTGKIESAPAVPPNARPDADAEFQKKFFEWARFVGSNTSGDEDLQGLGVLSQQGCCVKPEALQSYVGFLISHDVSTAHAVDLMKQANARLFEAYVCLSFGVNSSGGTCPVRQGIANDVVQLQNLESALGDLTALATLVQQRLITTAEILDFKLPSPGALNSEVETEFADRLNAIVDRVIANNPDLQGQANTLHVNAALLRAVSFHFDSGEETSFFQFIDSSSDSFDLRGNLLAITAGQNPIIPFVILDPRGVRTFPTIP